MVNLTTHLASRLSYGISDAIHGAARLGEFRQAVLFDYIHNLVTELSDNHMGFDYGEQKWKDFLDDFIDKEIKSYGYTAEITGLSEGKQDRIIISWEEPKR